MIGQIEQYLIDLITTNYFLMSADLFLEYVKILTASVF